MGISYRLLGGGVAALAASALAIGSLTGSASAAGGSTALATLDAATSPAAAGAAGYQFVEIGSHQDRTFNQLLGINNRGQIAGYFGAGVPGHPNKGYEISAPYAQNDFQHENFPGSVQTQITGLNDTGIEVGFFSTQNKNGNPDSNFGFWRQNGKYHEVNFPAKNNSTPPQDQLLGINDTGTAVGFYNDNAGNSHGFAYNIATKKFKVITVPGATSVTAAAINDKGTVAGFYVNAKGNTVSFTKTHTGKVTTIAVAGATATSALGLNDNGWVVGFYTTGSGNSAATHGFVFLPNGKFITKFDDPNGLGNTTLNGINNENDIVGFYGDAAGNTDGLVAFPPF
ncbi:hypothetical protein EAS64_01685 [Trebonia kvetii]|uniref:HAF repeat-containing protein n=1 Tax=Trebonia kvetii TaxID=2480626 RepID=A0A6P2C4T1_9ACTN|nr:hypothetical protein [Trebonia kvetii]TVZ06180.1 hypothetical protein EAS64_01685 [Trebonia kvetii]